MRIFFKCLCVAGWMFCIGWAFYIRQQIGMDVIMPMKYRAPLVLSFLGPPFLWCTWEIFKDYKKRLNETIEDKFDINR